MGGNSPSGHDERASRGTSGWASLFEAFYGVMVLRDFFGKIVPGSIVLIGIVWPFVLRDDVIRLSPPIWIWVLFLGISWIMAFGIQSLGERCGLRYYPKALDSMEWIKAVKEKIGVAIVQEGKELSIPQPNGTADNSSNHSKQDPANNAAAVQDVDGSRFRDQNWYSFGLAFDDFAGPRQQQTRERLTIIKEACGNSAIALAFTLIKGLLDLLIIVLFKVPFKTKAYTIAGIQDFSGDQWFLVSLPLALIVVIVFLTRMHFVHVNRQFEYMAQTIIKGLLKKQAKARDRMRNTRDWQPHNPNRR